jgi:hypothetical protein
MRFQRLVPFENAVSIRQLFQHICNAGEPKWRSFPLNSVHKLVDLETCNLRLPHFTWNSVASNQNGGVDNLTYDVIIIRCCEHSLSLDVKKFNLWCWSFSDVKFHRERSPAARLPLPSRCYGDTACKLMNPASCNIEICDTRHILYMFPFSDSWPSKTTVTTNTIHNKKFWEEIIAYFP